MNIETNTSDRIAAKDGSPRTSGSLWSMLVFLVILNSYGCKGAMSPSANNGFYSNPSYMAYSGIVARNAAAAQLDDSNGEHYDCIPTIQAKTQLAQQRASGIMIWEQSQDTNDTLSLLSAIYATTHP